MPAILWGPGVLIPSLSGSGGTGRGPNVHGTPLFTAVLLCMWLVIQSIGFELLLLFPHGHLSLSLSQCVSDHRILIRLFGCIETASKCLERW